MANVSGTIQTEFSTERERKISSSLLKVALSSVRLMVMHTLALKVRINVSVVIMPRHNILFLILNVTGNARAIKHKPVVDIGQ